MDKQLDWTEHFVQRIRDAKTPSAYQAAIRRALTFPTGCERLTRTIDFIRVYNEARFQVEDFAKTHEERWGLRWLPKRPEPNGDSMAGLHEHCAWWDRVEKAVRDQLPCCLDSEKVQLTLQVFQEFRRLINKYPDRDQKLLVKAVERWRSEAEKDPHTPRVLILWRRDRQVSSRRNEPLYEPEIRPPHNPAAVDFHYRALDRSYAGVVEGLAIDAAKLYERIAGVWDGLHPAWNGPMKEVWDEVRPIGLYDAVTGSAIGDAMWRARDAANEIRNGTMAEPGYRKETLSKWDTLITLFTGFRENICQAQRDEAKSSEETTSPQSGTTKRQPSENGGAHVNVNIQNSTVNMGDIHQTQNLATGNRSSIGKETQTPTAIVASWLWRTMKALFHRIWRLG